jgi:hypothetical protein
MPVTSDRVDVSIEIDKEQVCRYIGYEDGQKLSARISSLVDDYAEHAHGLVNPSYAYVIKDVEWARGSIAFIEGSISFKSRIIAKLLGRCTQVAIFLVTIGRYLEETSFQLAKDGLVLQATVLDAIGSVAVEQVAGFVQARVREIARADGHVTSRRFSPGYCDWNIGQQQMLFYALTGNTIGIRLTGECLMIPQKSMSGIIGIGPSSANVENYDPCKTCRKKDCPGRR